MKVWFITGASRGFGALITKEALAAGDAVVATARNPKTVIDAIGDHPNLLATALDVTDEREFAFFRLCSPVAETAPSDDVGTIGSRAAEEDRYRILYRTHPRRNCQNWVAASMERSSRLVG